ncbi:MAG TPA: hypothetical protein VFN49_08495 [Candidatus Aquilonibacter sp.]|nr:hypothetical protein [Candidatus Aquilonibacter sp.]
MSVFRSLSLVAMLGVMLLGASPAMKTYVSPKYHVSVTYPSSWIDKGVAKVDLLNPDYTGAYNSFAFGPKMDGEILVAVVPSAPMTRDAFLAAYQSILDEMGMNLKAENVSDVEVNGLKGFQFDYGAGTQIGRVHLAVFFANGKRYVIEAMGFDERKGEYASYATVIDDVFASFKLLPGA